MDIRSVDLNLLVALDALLTERNVTRAAGRLALSQSALSATLGRLRALFTDTLLLRTAGGMLPTSKGLELAAPVKQLVADVGRLVQQAGAFDPATARRLSRSRHRTTSSTRSCRSSSTGWRPRRRSP